VKGVKISIEPNPVAQNEVVTITVSVPDGGGSTGWFMRIVAAHDSAVVKCEPRGLGAYGAPREGDPGTYDCEIQTVRFETGGYLVDLSPTAAFDPQYMASKKFTVTGQRMAIATANWAGSDGDPILGGMHHGLP